jgi:hypothetical protein
MSCRVRHRVSNTQRGFSTQGVRLKIAHGESPGANDLLKIIVFRQISRLVGFGSIAEEHTIGFDQTEVNVIGGQLEEVGKMPFASSRIVGENQEWKLRQGTEQLPGILDNVFLAGGDQLRQRFSIVADRRLLESPLRDVALDDQAKGGQDQQ